MSSNASEKDNKEPQVQTIPFGLSENQNLNAVKGEASFQNLVGLKGVTIVSRIPCCPPCTVCKKRQFFVFPIFSDDTTSPQSIAVGVDMTPCGTKFCKPSIINAGLNLQILENKNQTFTGDIAPKGSCVCYCSCCPSFEPMIVSSSSQGNIATMIREVSCCKYHRRTFVDKDGTPKYIIDPLKNICKQIFCQCCGCYCCCCCGTEGCCSCEDKFIVFIGSFGNGDDGLLIRRVKYCPPCKRPTYDIIFPKGASQEMRAAMCIGVMELDYFQCYL